MVNLIIKIIVIGVFLFVVVAILIQYLCSVSESYLRRHLKNHLEWLKLANSPEGKLMKKSIENVLEGHDTKEMLNKHDDARKLLEDKVPCYFEHRRKGPMASNCPNCNAKNSCMLCVSNP